MKVPEILIMFGSLAGLATVLAVYTERLTVGAALDIGMLLTCLVWLFFLVKIPWDLYFATRQARIDGQESLRLGMKDVTSQTQQLVRMEGLLLGGALGGHAFTALGIYVLSGFRPDLIGTEFSWLFVASAALRPAWEGYGYLRQRVRDLASQVRYPREDVRTLQDRVSNLGETQNDLSHQIKASQAELNVRLHQLDQATQQLQSQQIAELARLEKRTVQLSQRFEEVLEKVSSDQELLAGVRAFARMMREPSSA